MKFLSKKFSIFKMSYFLIVLYMKYPIFEMSNLWNVQTFKMSYLWNVLYTKFPIYKMSYLLNILDMKCPNFEMSFH